MSKIIKLFLLIIIFSCQPNDNSVIPIIQNTEVCLDDITIDEAKIGYSSQIASVRKSLNRYETGEPDWKNASIWFCGPTGFGAKLKGELTKAGLNSVDFHQEIFNLR